MLASCRALQYYFSPGGQRFRSRQEIVRHLETAAQQSKTVTREEAASNAQVTAEKLDRQLPFTLDNGTTVVRWVMAGWTYTSQHNDGLVCIFSLRPCYVHTALLKVASQSIWTRCKQQCSLACTSPCWQMRKCQKTCLVCSTTLDQKLLSCRLGKVDAKPAYHR